MKISEFMNYEEAMEHLDKGAKVKLPEWAGHWYKGENGQTLVETRAGEISDTPYPDYTNRTDWFVTDGRRDFSSILHAIKAGCKATRAGWKGNGMYVFLKQGYPVNGFAQPKDTVAPPLDVYPHLEGQMVSSFLIRLAGDSEYWGAGFADYCGWQPTVMDLLAEDWEIVRD